MARKSRKPEPGGQGTILREDTGVPEPTPMTGEPADMKREFILTRTADETLYDAVRVLSRETGTDLTNSHFLRAVLRIIAKGLPSLRREASRIGRLKRPSNARGKEAERDEYERKLAAAIGAALRSFPLAELDAASLDVPKKPRKSSH